MEMSFRIASVLVKAVVQAKDHDMSGEVKDCLCDSRAIGDHSSVKITVFRSGDWAPMAVPKATESEQDLTSYANSCAKLIALFSEGSDTQKAIHQFAADPWCAALSK